MSTNAPFRSVHLCGSTGFALVLVLWVIALLSVVAGSFAYAMRGEARLARNLVDHAHASALADGGINLAIARLMNKDAANRWRMDGTQYSAALGGEQVVVSVRSELGKIDLNRASEELLKGAVASAVAGVEQIRYGADDPEGKADAPQGEEAGADADALADRILDWRDDNRNRRLNGAEDDDYEAAGRPYGSRDGPFVSVDELTQILGMTRSVFERLAPLVTIHSGRPKIDPGAAPAAVLLAVPGVSPEQVSNFLDAREVAAASGVAPSIAGLTPSSPLFSTPLPADRPRAGVFTVHATATAGISTVHREAVVQIRSIGTLRRSRTSARGTAQSRARRAPYNILVWKAYAPAGGVGGSPDSERPPAG